MEIHECPEISMIMVAWSTDFKICENKDHHFYDALNNEIRN